MLMDQTSNSATLQSDFGAWSILAVWCTTRGICVAYYQAVLETSKFGVSKFSHSCLTQCRDF